jgi:hypothetical protein
VMQQASLVLDQIESEGAVLDPGQLADMITQTSSGSGSSIATLVLAGCWLVGIVDTYRLSYKS